MSLVDAEEETLVLHREKIITASPVSDDCPIQKLWVELCEAERFLHDEFVEWANKQSDLSNETIRFFRPAVDVLERNRLKLRPELYRFVREEMLERTLVRDLNELMAVMLDMIQMRQSGLDDRAVIARASALCTNMQQNFLNKLHEFKELVEKLTGEQLISI
ncbi:MAG: hypothetical protein WBD22_13445 [Pyrinomonadaceae bacterium]